MRPPRVVLVIVAIAVVVPALVPATAAAPPPEGVCGVCGSAFEQSAEEVGVDATVVESDLAVHVSADGDSRWTAHVVLSRPAADRFAANRTLLRRAVEQTYASYRTAVDDPRNLSVGLDDRTVTVSFTVADAAQRYPGDVLLFDAFARSPPDGEPYVDADELSVHGPTGTAVTHAPAGGTVDGNRVVWTASEDGRTYSPRLGREASVAFGPNDGLPSRAATAVAVRGHSLDVIGPELRAYALAPAALLGIVAVGLLLTGGRLPVGADLGRTAARWLAVGVGLYVALAAVAFLLVGDGLGYVLGVVGIGLAPQAFLTATVAVVTDYRDVASGGSAASVTSLAVLAVLGWTLALVLGAPASALLVLTVGPLVFLPFGVLAAAGHRARLLFPVVAALGPVVAALPLVPRVGVVFVTPAMLTLLLAGSAVLGVPLFAIGRRLSSRATSAAGSADGAGD
ncbi:hypothetical protein [Halorussus litoreus]|uniref:hypothetical protein n=1 Tax=Halorussus litoreus TaxID=1710536 RepID=UPI001300B806|nr:hypothetical protein [Halorussus litoreus]